MSTTSGEAIPSTGSHAAAARTRARNPEPVNLAQLPAFDEIIDVRSEGEFAEDHIPGAISCPVLNDAERIEVGTLYKQVSSFDAKKLGASLVSANIARHLRERFQDRPKKWRPLIYCWRGGGRSDAMAHVLAKVGWQVGRLEGGYKAYRRTVIAQLTELPGQFQWRVVCGLTGSGKSRLLGALADAGEQVLDLEALAVHRGSVLGNVPGVPQPSQKFFESLVWRELQRFDRRRPVYVEAESKRIGSVRVPEALIESMWRSECVVLSAPMPLRLVMLKEEYSHFLESADDLGKQLDCLTSLHGRERISRWKEQAAARQWDELVSDLLVSHYDPAYTRSTLKHYPALSGAQQLTLNDAGADAFAQLAAECAASGS